MADGALQATKTATMSVRQAPARAAIPRRMLARPGEAAERSVHARSARALSGAFQTQSRSQRAGRARLTWRSLAVSSIPAGASRPQPVTQARAQGQAIVCASVQCGPEAEALATRPRMAGLHACGASIGHRGSARR